MKNMVLLMVLLATLSIPLISCSPDRAEEEEETEVLLLPPESNPDPWAEETTIIVGTYTGAEILSVLEQVQIEISTGTYTALKDPGFPVQKEEQETRVAVISLLEAGFNKPATMAEIRKRLREMGYRPLTLEEAVMTRLQIRQPDTLSENKMSCFYTLLTEEDAEWLGKEAMKKDGPRMFVVYRLAERFGYKITTIGTLGEFDPYKTRGLIGMRTKIISSFACAVINK